jgi:fused signal recognition particle receptor
MLGGLSNALLGKKEIDEEVLEGLEEALLGADIGPETTEQILEVVTSRVERQELRDVNALREVIKEEIVRILHKEVPIPTVVDRKPLVLMFVGVNGVGKTTTIGKIAAQYRRDGHRVLMGAGDTFRAAAIEQLTEWSCRAECDIIAKSQGVDPSSVMYEAVEKAVREEYDVVICDTAGRLHTKKNLMEELRKMVRVIRKIIPDAPHEVLLVLDATTGQNAIFQAREFREAADLTGIVMTKLDGTAKGGVIIGIVNEFDIPVRYIGVGEGIEDLRPYDAKQFTDSLFS